MSNKLVLKHLSGCLLDHEKEEILEYDTVCFTSLNYRSISLIFLKERSQGVSLLLLEHTTMDMTMKMENTNMNSMSI